MKKEHKETLNIIKNILHDLIAFKEKNFLDLEIFIVGGFLRNIFLKKYFLNSIDIDFALNKNTKTFSHNFSKKIKSPFICLDEKNDSYRIIKKINKKNIQLDFTAFRGKDIKADINKRDFTINSFAIKLESFYKILNDLIKINSEDSIYGLDYNCFLYPKNATYDIKHKIVRMNNEKIFKDDPIRLLRAIRIFDNKSFKLEKKTKNQILRESSLIKLSAKERVHDEIIKIFSKKYVFNSVLLLNETKLLENIFGESFITSKLEKDFYYHKDGLFGHLLETLYSFEFIVKNLNKIFNKKDILDKKIVSVFKKVLKDKLILALCRLICLFHDIGKPETKSFINNKIHFLNHEEFGEKKVVKIFKNLKFSNKELNFLKKSILFHMQPSNLSKLQDITNRAIYRFFKRIDDENIALFLLIFSAADILASIKGKLGFTYCDNITLKDILLYEDFNKYIDFMRKMLNWLLFNFKIKNSKKFLNGYEIMKLCNIPSGKKVGEILNFLYEKVALNEINTKKEAIEKVKSFINKSCIKSKSFYNDN